MSDGRDELEGGESPDDGATIVPGGGGRGEFEVDRGGGHRSGSGGASPTPVDGTSLPDDGSASPLGASPDEGATLVPGGGSRGGEGASGFGGAFTGSLADRFEILGPLGEGGMGVVLKARDKRLGREVALKRLKDDSAESHRLIDRFEREARTVAGLEHPNIVRLYDVLDEPGGVVILMELLDGGSLQQRIDMEGALPVDEVVRIGVQLCEALEAAHARGIVHRDIKPGNVLMTRRGTPKLADFGLAVERTREGDGRQTVTGSLLGTPHYAAPEQLIDGKGVDARADLYALGATLYAASTGTSPRMIKIDRVPETLRPMIEKCLEERAEDRYQTASEMAEALRESSGKASTTRLPVELERLIELALSDGVLSDREADTLIRKAESLGLDRDEFELVLDAQVHASGATRERSAPVPAPLASVAGACPTCGAANEKDAKFCGDCGAGFFEACPKCNRESRVGTKYCGGCGVVIESARKERQAEEARRREEANREEEVRRTEEANREKEIRRSEEASREEVRERREQGVSRCSADGPPLALVEDSESPSESNGLETLCAQIRSDFKDEKRVYWDMRVDSTRIKTMTARCRSGAPIGDVIFGYDETIIGSAKDGLLVTTEGLHARDMFEDPWFVSWRDLTSASLIGSDGVFATRKLLIQPGDRRMSLTFLSSAGRDQMVNVLNQIRQWWHVREMARLEHATRRSARSRARWSQKLEQFVPRGSVRLRLTEAVSLTLRWIAPGQCVRGSPYDERDRCADESPHVVSISKGLWLGQTPVTQAQWEAIMGVNPSSFEGDKNRPVENVSSDDAQEFLRHVNEKFLGLDLRLPTEAEWEYACRAGSTTAYCFGDDSGRLDESAWFSGNSGGSTHPVARKKPNAWGLYDMHGNVWEWCSDWFGNYPSGAVIDPLGPASGTVRVLRGGSWNSGEGDCRSSARHGHASGSVFSDTGFRVARTP